MHAFAFVVAVTALALAGTFPQEKPADRLPRKGDSVVVKGCLKGRALEATETGLLDSTARAMTALVYRLTGDKELLKKLRDDHEGQIVEVTGILKSTLPPADDTRGATIGRTRVRIGVGAPNVGTQANAEASRSIPVLEVKSYEGAPVRCGG